jgi:hypothetical protein
MRRPGNIGYGELLDRIMAAGLTLPRVSEDGVKRMARTMNAPLDGDDGLVLGTVNAPFKREITAVQLAQCLRSRDPGDWLVHVATFFTDVRPALVLKFAERHGISLDRLGGTYRSLKDATGERHRDLEAAMAEAWQHENAEAFRQHSKMVERDGPILGLPDWWDDIQR